MASSPTSGASISNVGFVDVVTTTFSAPSWCSTPIVTYEDGLDYAVRDMSCGDDGYPTYASDCFPRDISSPYGGMTYSSATACPSGWDIQSPMKSDDTSIVGCCPSGFKSAEGDLSCYSTLSTDASSTPGYGDVFTCSGSEPVPFTGTLVYTDEVWGIQIHLHQTNVDSSTASDSQQATILSVTTSSTTSASPTHTSNSKPPSKSSHGRKKKSGGISTGAIAGIVVGGVAAILLLFGALLSLRRRKQAQKATKSTSNSDALPEYVGSTKPKSDYAYGSVPPKSPMEETSEHSTGMFQPQPTDVNTR